MNENTKTIVIGSGFGGIAAALRLRALGHEVTIVEKLSSIGGRAQVFNFNGFKHDAGPTLITAPFMFEDLFKLFNEDINKYLKFVPLNPWYRFYFHDKTSFDYCSDIKETQSQIGKFSKEDAVNYLDLLKESKKIFDVGFTKLSDVSFSSFLFMLKQIPSLIKLRSYLTVSQITKKYLKHPKIQSAFSIHPLLVGGNPFKTTSIYALIHYVERNWGIFFCMGGTGKIIDELNKLMIKNKIKIVLNQDITHVNVKNNKIVSIHSNTGTKYDCDKLVFNGDPSIFYDEILKEKSIFKRKKFLPEFLTKYSMGLFVLYFGSKKKYDDVAHHTIWMGKRFQGLLEDIFENKKLAEDFSLYIHRPTATDSSFAPKGCDSFYVLCPVPNLLGDTNWDKESNKLKDKIITALDRTMLPNLKNNICEVHYMNPINFKDDYRSKHGAGFSIAPIFTQSAWFRFHNKDPHISNLYFSSSGAHPGAGLPGVLSSAKVVENIIKNEQNPKYGKAI